MTMMTSSFETPVTVRRKRGRKKVEASTTKSQLEKQIIEDTENFLNEGNSSATSAASTSKSQQQNGSTSNEWKRRSREEFQRACRDVDVEFWKTQHATALPGLILHASTETTAGNSGSLLLEGHAKSLLKVSTTMISEASQIHKELKEQGRGLVHDHNSKAKRQTQYNLLLVAIHSTCAVWRRTIKTENIVKVLYHALMCIEQAILDAKSARVFSLANLACQAFATISTILAQSKVQDSTSSDCYTFQYKSDNNHGFLFPRPIQQTNKQSSSSKDLLNLPMEKLAAVAVHSLLIMAKVFLHTSRNITNNDITDHDLFRPYSKNERLQKDTVRHWGMTLLTQISVDWTVFSCNQLGSTATLNYVGNIRRILTEMADQEPKESKERLILYQNAILVLLLGGRVQNSKCRRELEEQYLELACKLACRASESFYQKDGASATDLNSFHEKVGSLIEQCSESPSLSFLDYTVCRPLHTAVLLKHTNNTLGFQWKIPQSFGPAMNAIIRSYWLALLLKSILRNEQNPMELNTTQFIEFVDLIASEFQEHSAMLINIPSDQLARVTKWFSSLSIHCTLYNIAAEAKTSDQSSQTNNVALQAAARVSILCIAPLFLYMAQNSPNCDAERAGKLWELYIEHVCRGIIALDIVLQGNSGHSISKMRRFADSSMLQMVQNTTRYAPVHCVEKAAKIMNLCGNMRDKNGNKPHAATPLLLTICLYSSCKPCKPSYLLDQRWNYLASLFRSIDKPKLESVCILASLREKAHMSTGGESVGMMPKDMLSRLSDKCYGNVPRLGANKLQSEEVLVEDRTVQSLVARLCQLFQDPTECSIRDKMGNEKVEIDKKECFATENLVEAILNDMRNQQSIDVYVQTALDDEFSLSNLSNAIILTSDQSKDESVTKLEILISIAERLALTISRRWKRFEYHESLEELRRILQHMKLFIFSFSRDMDPNIQEAVSTLTYLSISTHLISSSAMVETDFWSWKEHSMNDLPEDVLKSSLYFARSAKKCIVCEGLCRVLRPVIDFYILRLERKSCMKNIQSAHMTQQLTSCAEYFMSSIDLKENAFVTWLIECLCAFSITFSDWIMHLGEGVEALQLSSMILTIAKQYSDCESKKILQTSLPLLEAKVLSFGSGEYAIPLLKDSCSENLRCDDPSHILLLTNRIRHELLWSMDKECVDQHRQTLNELLFTATRTNNAAQSKNWLISSINFVLADAANCLGDFESALKFTRNASVMAADTSMDCGVDTSIHLSSFLVQNRILECSMRLASLYSDLGERRKAESYALFSAQYLEISLESEELHTSTLNFSKQEMRVYSLVESILARKKPVNAISVQASLQSMQEDDWKQAHALTTKCRFFDPAVVRNEAFLGLYRKTEQCFENFRDRESTRQMALTLPAVVAPHISSELSLNKAKAAFTQHGVCEEEQRDMVYSTCVELCRKPTSSRGCRCEALYLMGLLYLQKARETGILVKLWRRRPSSSPDDDDFLEDSKTDIVEKARDSFRSALALSGSSSSVLAQKILRSLALVLGPECEEVEGYTSPHQLLQASIGSSQCSGIARTLPQDSEAQKHFSSLQNLSGNSYEDYKDFYTILNKVAPCNWNFVCMALCPTGELLVSKWRKSQDSETGDCNTMCIFGEQRMYDMLITPLDKVLRRNQQQIDDTKAHPPATRDEIREWWTTRKSIDESMRKHLSEIEESWISDSVASFVFDKASEDAPTSMGASTINLDSKFAALANDDEEIETTSFFIKESMSEVREKLQVLGVSEQAIDTFPESEQLCNELKKLRVVDLKELLSDIGVTSKVVRELRIKAKLLDHFIDTLSQEASKDTSEREKKNPVLFLDDESDLSSTILILDEHLQRFPFESLPSFENKSVCRIPSLPFALAKLCEIQGDTSRLSIDPDHTSYVLDPESNLPGTLKRVDSSLREMKSFKESMWDNVTGRIPSKAFMLESLTRDQGLFLYFGHGDTKSFFSTQDLLELQGEDASGVCRRLKSAVVMMGCSSGRLQSVVQKDSAYNGEEQFLNYGPEGMALSYLGAGAPCVVGNLWDVTDSDIDRYSIACMNHFFESKSSGVTSLSESVAKARSACKLRYITGAAPVYYGLPTTIW